MARIRTIKPEFPQSESIGKLSRDARLLYIQLWTIVDDAGRARAASRMLASLLYPYDDEARDLIDGWLRELEQGEHIHRYEVDGSQYLEIVKWLEHQKIDKPSKSRLPAFVDGSRIVAKVREASATDLGPRTVDLVPVPAKPVAKSLPRTSDAFERFKKAFPRRDGANPWQPAEKKFNALVKTGVDPEAMIRAAAELAREEGTRGNIGTKFIPQAITWLNQQRFQDYAAVSFEAESGAFDWDAVCVSFKKFGHWSKHAGNGPDSPGCQCPPEILAKHGILLPLPDNQAHIPLLRTM
jgi:hypothetical protein